MKDTSITILTKGLEQLKIAVVSIDCALQTDDQKICFCAICVDINCEHVCSMVIISASYSCWYLNIMFKKVIAYSKLVLNSQYKSTYFNTFWYAESWKKFD